MIRFQVAVTLSILVLATVAGCQSAPRSRSATAATVACRAEVDRVYAAQNRVDLSLRDQRDTPFASGYNSGITSEGLGARYGRDNQLASCINNSTAPGTAAPAAAGAPGTGPTFSPVAR
jgi:hypothetical protein